MLSLVRRLLCSPRLILSRCHTCLPGRSFLKTKTAEHSPRDWSGRAHAWSFVLTAEVRSIALLYFKIISQTSEHAGEFNELNRLAILPPFTGHFPLWRQK